MVSEVVMEEEPVAVDGASLRERTMEELDAMFADLEPTEARELEGMLAGEVLATFLDGVLGKALGRVVVAILGSQLSPWTGKRFDGRSGANVWLTSSGRITLVNFRAREATGFDGGEVLMLDYDVPENLPPLRRIAGELRRVGPGVHIGRMSYRLASGAFPVLYFLLSA